MNLDIFNRFLRCAFTQLASPCARILIQLPHQTLHLDSMKVNIPTLSVHVQNQTKRPRPSAYTLTRAITQPAYTGLKSPRVIFKNNASLDTTGPQNIRRVTKGIISTIAHNATTEICVAKEENKNVHVTALITKAITDHNSRTSGMP